MPTDGLGEVVVGFLVDWWSGGSATTVPPTYTAPRASEPTTARTSPEPTLTAVSIPMPR